ncbi:hypothetical protein [Maliponia aquimaris]|uniref:Uncharacterized protein n=1 Tax=Maliponia aquimaris TaxID=1673631 RepID=A0A238KZN9_9RHOB|nr:hypothetical protein [Maliponia aquimaris]SMX48090.1 hypothetical protein MAA8898_03856 [Maliponia aquimaris]
MLFDPEPGETVQKLMSVTLAEFETGVARLTGAAAVSTGAVYDLSPAAAGKPVTAHFVPQPDAVLGGLVRLPRVQVTLDLRALDKDARAGFVLQFDRVFQRGGG